jgi:hypothetical protein
VEGKLIWSGGVMTGDATTIIAEGATALINSNAVYLREGRDFINHGTVTQSGNGVMITDTPNTASTITNAAGAQWTSNLNNHNRMVWPNHSTATLNFLNAGTLTKSSADLNYLGHANGTFNMTSTGTIEVESGTLRLEGTSVVLSNSGKVRLTTNGTIAPLIRPGTLTIGGTLEVILADGYAPTNGTVVRLIDYGSRSGDFDTITPPQGRTLAETYAGDGLDVTID